MVSPTSAAFWSAAGVTWAFLSMATSGEGATLVTVAVEGALGGLAMAFGSLPVAVAVSTTLPWSTSVWVTVYRLLAVQVSESPGARPGAGGTGQVTGPPVGSDTATVVRLSSPVLVTRYRVGDRLAHRHGIGVAARRVGRLHYRHRRSR